MSQSNVSGVNKAINMPLFIMLFLMCFIVACEFYVKLPDTFPVFFEN